MAEQAEPDLAVGDDGAATLRIAGRPGECPWNGISYHAVGAQRLARSLLGSVMQRLPMRAAAEAGEDGSRQQQTLNRRLPRRSC
jgi:hypothetical protein